MPALECEGGPWDGQKITVPPTTKTVHVYKAPPGVASRGLVVPVQYRTPANLLGVYHADGALLKWKPDTAVRS